MTIATVSLNQIWEDKKENLLLCEEYLKYASQEKVDLIIFPEMTLTGFSTNISLTAEDENNSESILQFSDLSKKYNIAIIFGVVIKDNNKALNKSILTDKNGNVKAKYSKIHPFSFSGEDKYFNGGNELEIVNLNDINIGLTICYDLRFPELYSALAKKSDIIINIANWPEKRVDHWNTFLKARAIENQLFIIGVNRTGIDRNNLEYQESSNLFNANGEIVEYNSFKDMKIFKIDTSFTTDFKNNFNTTNDRKVKLYKDII
jgi:predicted amidohydrolase